MIEFEHLVIVLNDVLFVQWCAIVLGSHLLYLIFVPESCIEV